VGMDMKYSLTPSLTLDLTSNTDFAQVEVDQQQINLDRFSLFFPEKRPFFLENAGAFAVGNSGGGGRGLAQLELFFSRRIGIGPGGREIPILGGARLSGKVSESVTVGLLNMQTRAVEGVTPANNFTVARVRRDLPNRSNIGALFVNRQATGRLAGRDDYNRSYAVDANWGIGPNALVAGFVARTETPGLDGGEYAYSLSGDYRSQAWRYTVGYTEVADNFNPEVGFLRRQGFRNVGGGVYFTHRPESFLKIQEITPHATYDSFWKFDGFQETGRLHLDFPIEFNDSSLFHPQWNITREGVIDAFEISEGVVVPSGTYDHHEVQIQYDSDRSAPVSFGLLTMFSGFFGGDRKTYGPSIFLRSGETLSAELRWTRNDIDLPGGAFVTNLATGQIAYNFSPRLFLQSLVQYNDDANLWSANVRFGWLQQANTGLFIVYNDTRGLGDQIPSGGGRSLVVKFSQMLNVID
jgi:hypothetical protein